MRQLLPCLPLALLFLASAVPSNGQSVSTEATPADLDAEFKDITFFEYRGNFSLNCSSLAGPGATIIWKKDDKVVEEIPELKGHVLIQATGGVPRGQLTLGGRARDADAGNYTCEAGAASQTWEVHARPVAKMSPDTNVVEGQKLKLTCKIIGLPLPAVRWSYSNVSAEQNFTDVSEAFGDRAVLSASEQGVGDGQLVLEAARDGDAGWFRCEPAVPRALSAVTRLRVKDMYAALWPFLGICAEVLILCTIILVYERRRTKPELDDSDTDNHDQKKS